MRAEDDSFTAFHKTHEPINSRYLAFVPSCRPRYANALSSKHYIFCTCYHKTSLSCQVPVIFWPYLSEAGFQPIQQACTQRKVQIILFFYIFCPHKQHNTFSPRCCQRELARGGVCVCVCVWCVKLFSRLSWQTEQNPGRARASCPLSSPQ